MRADRLLKMMLLLQTRGKMTAQSLAQELMVSRRTILRDLDALSFAGIPVYAEGGHGGGISLDEHYRVKLNGLKESEIHALILSRDTILLADIGLEDASEQSLLKVLTALPSLYEKAIQQVQHRIHIDPIEWWRCEPDISSLSELRQAVYEDRLLQFTYQKHNGEVVHRRVQPYGLVAKASRWYLIAKHEIEFRSYRVKRIRDVVVLDDTFLRDPHFDLASHWQASIRHFMDNRQVYSFTLQIQPDKLQFVQWYTPGTTHVVQTLDDGQFIAQFEVDSEDVAIMFILGLGADAQIIEPHDLREKTDKHILSLMLNQHSLGKSE